MHVLGLRETEADLERLGLWVGSLRVGNESWVFEG